MTSPMIFQGLVHRALGQIAVVVACCAIAPFSTAQNTQDQEPPPVPATPVPPEAAPLEEEKLDQYADAFIDVEKIEAEATAELEKAKDPAAAFAIKEKAEGAIIEAIERSGLKLDEFNQITEVASLDEGVRRRIADHVEKRRRI